MVTLVASSVSSADVSDRGTLNVTRATTATAVLVATRTVNPGASVAKDHCLTLPAGDAAVYECGDLRLVHSFPATTTMNRLRPGPITSEPGPSIRRFRQKHAGFAADHPHPPDNHTQDSTLRCEQ